MLTLNYPKKKTELTAYAEKVVRSYLPELSGYNKTLLEAMDYSVEAGGKRLRPVLMYLSFRMCGGASRIIEPFMAAIEMIHTYSLVHDDLPEMDNDELRRGKPTTHVAYGHAMAVLAGDGLLNYAYETMAKALLNATEKEKAGCAQALSILADKAGIHGMVGGQSLDVEAEKKDMELSEEQLLFVYENKTAALLQASLMCGAALAGAYEYGCAAGEKDPSGTEEKGREVMRALEKAGYNLGIAFQLQDDLLDITSTTDTLGKPIGSDERNGKKTYVSYLGMERAQAEQKRLSEEAVDLIRGLDLMQFTASPEGVDVDPDPVAGVDKEKQEAASGAGEAEVSGKEAAEILTTLIQELVNREK